MKSKLQQIVLQRLFKRCEENSRLETQYGQRRTERQLVGPLMLATVMVTVAALVLPTASAQFAGPGEHGRRDHGPASKPKTVTSCSFDVTPAPQLVQPGVPPDDGLPYSLTGQEMGANTWKLWRKSGDQYYAEWQHRSHTSVSEIVTVSLSGATLTFERRAHGNGVCRYVGMFRANGEVRGYSQCNGVYQPASRWCGK